MNTLKTEILNRSQLQQLITERNVKHSWLASVIGVSEKSLTRWINGATPSVKVNNLKKLAEALDCELEALILSTEAETYSSEKNRDLLVNELHNDSLLYNLLISSKLKLAISLIKSTFHSGMPNAIMASFYTKLGYAHVIQRQQKSAKKFFLKAQQKAFNTGNQELLFSTGLGLAITYLFDFDFEKCRTTLDTCEQLIEHSGKEKAHFHSTNALYYLSTGQLECAVNSADACIRECSPDSPAIEKQLFLCTGLQLKGAAILPLGDGNTARDLCRESLQVAEMSGYSRCINVAKSYLAAIEAANGQIELAEVLSSEALQSTSDNDISIASILCIHLYVQIRNGCEDKLLDLLEQLATVTPKNSLPMAYAHY
ncbi:MAG: helix-turn-helix domain-containing protein [Alteromonadaceae bacterium]|nr:helix-turn-helix domain-containing protein [Alteromonadaceae bacterium]